MLHTLLEVAACYPRTDAHTFLIIFIFSKNIKLLLKELDYKKKKNMIKKPHGI
jgi:hypothetical protein